VRSSEDDETHFSFLRLHRSRNRQKQNAARKPPTPTDIPTEENKTASENFATKIL
jgi:hypothetical protein